MPLRVIAEAEACCSRQQVRHLQHRAQDKQGLGRTAGALPGAKCFLSSWCRGVSFVSISRSARCLRVPPAFSPNACKASFNLSAPAHRHNPQGYNVQQVLIISTLSQPNGVSAADSSR